MCLYKLYGNHHVIISGTIYGAGNSDPSGAHGSNSCPKCCSIVLSATVRLYYTIVIILRWEQVDISRKDEIMGRCRNIVFVLYKCPINKTCPLLYNLTWEMKAYKTKNVQHRQVHKTQSKTIEIHK